MEKALVVVLVGAALGAAMVGVDLHAQNVRYPVQVSPIKPAAPTNIHRSLYWIDNDSVLFPATPGDVRGTSSPEIQMVIWNSRDDSIKTLGQQAAAFSPFCYSDGYLRFATRIEGGEVVFKEGMLTSLSEKRIPRAEIQSDAARKRGELPNLFTCTSYNMAELGPRGRCLIPLRVGDGYLDLTGGACTEKFKQGLDAVAKLPSWEGSRMRSQLDDERRAQPAAYLETLAGREIQLPIKAGEVGARSVHYSTWSNSYVIRANSTVPRAAGSVWPKGQPRPVYLLSRGGSIARVDMPYTSWNTGEMAAAVLTRTGVFVVSHAIGRNYDVGHAGIYRIAQHKLEPVFTGYVIGLAVSPSGCKVAAISQDRKSFAFRMNSIDVCIGRG